MADVQCVNEECPEHDVVKTNPAGFPVEDIACGRCGGPVQPVENAPEP